MAVIGAVCWLVVHPENALEDDGLESSPLPGLAQEEESVMP